MAEGTLNWITQILVIIGAINWGLVGIFNFNLVELILQIPLLIDIVYILVGLSGLYAIYSLAQE